MAKVHLMDQPFYLQDVKMETPIDFSMANSLIYYCRDQREINRVWQSFIEFQGEEYPSGWLIDKFGVSWQITPENFDDLFDEDDPVTAKKVTEAMYSMKKLDYDKLLEIANKTEKIR